LGFFSPLPQPPDGRAGNASLCLAIKNCGPGAGKAKGSRPPLALFFLPGRRGPGPSSLGGARGCGTGARRRWHVEGIRPGAGSRAARTVTVRFSLRLRPKTCFASREIREKSNKRTNPEEMSVRGKGGSRREE